MVLSRNLSRRRVSCLDSRPLAYCRICFQRAVADQHTLQYSHDASRSTAAVGPELVFALVGAVGADLTTLGRILSESLSDVSYQSETVRLSDLLKGIPGFANLKDSPLDDRYKAYMQAGTKLRELIQRPDALAILGVQSIRQRREKISAELGLEGQHPPRVAYVLHSLKRPEEVETLRKIYSPGFFLIAAYSPREKRLKRLEEQIADSHHVAPPQNEHKRAAEDLIIVDEKEHDRTFGQNVRDTFPMADFFVDVSATEPRIRRDIKRFLALLFGYPFHTPTRDENGMFHARAAAVRSSEMGRQVGAAIASADGEILAVGTNDVPKAGGGLYWAPEEDEADHRDFMRGEDTSDRMKRNNLAEVLDALKKGGLLRDDLCDLPPGELLTKAANWMKSTRLMNAIEFGRAVHAEMDAITGAARRGINIREATLYTTTFPCHNCARHIVSAGIRRVVFIEPYAKSLASEFHQDSVILEEQGSDGDRVVFAPFVGVAPRRYLHLFQAVQRKTPDGKKVIWDRQGSQPRIYPPNLNYADREIEQSSGVGDAILSAGLGDNHSSSEGSENG